MDVRNDNGKPNSVNNITNGGYNYFEKKRHREFIFSGPLNAKSLQAVEIVSALCK